MRDEQKVIRNKSIVTINTSCCEPQNQYDQMYQISAEWNFCNEVEEYCIHDGLDERVNPQKRRQDDER